MIALLLAACSLPSGGPRWDAVDVEAIEAQLAAPTASRATALGWVLANTATVQAMAEAGGTATEVLAVAAAPTDAVPVERASGELAGTEIFLQIACPGPGDGPDPDFEHGALLLESPLLALADLTEAAVQGDMLLTFSACERGETRYDGAAAAWYDAPSAVLVADGVLDTLRGEQTTALPIQTALAPELWSFIVEVTEGGLTVSVDIPPEAPEQVTVRHRDGALACAIGDVAICVDAR